MGPIDLDLTADRLQGYPLPATTAPGPAESGSGLTTPRCLVAQQGPSEQQSPYAMQP